MRIREENRRHAEKRSSGRNLRWQGLQEPTRNLTRQECFGWQSQRENGEQASRLQKEVVASPAADTAGMFPAAKAAVVAAVARVVIAASGPVPASSEDVAAINTNMKTHRRRRIGCKIWVAGNVYAERVILATEPD